MREQAHVQYDASKSDITLKSRNISFKIQLIYVFMDAYHSIANTAFTSYTQRQTQEIRITKNMVQNKNGRTTAMKNYER